MKGKKKVLRDHHKGAHLTTEKYIPHFIPHILIDGVIEYTKHHYLNRRENQRKIKRAYANLKRFLISFSAHVFTILP
jgi:hypothetical protein